MAMHRIGVVSDTHGTLDSRVLELFAGVDLIIHAGDVGREEILIDLKAVAPTVAIFGNIDIGGPIPGLPEEEILDIEGVEIFVRHGHQHADPLRRISAVLERKWNRSPDVVIVGHSHRPYLAEHRGVLILNPGSASRPRYGFPASVGFLSLESGRVSGEIVDLGGKPLTPGDKV
jgi:putative phosphoesterase